MISYDLILRDLILLAVWTRVINNLVQGIVHLVTYAMLRRTGSEDAFSVALRQRELSLGFKNLVGISFNLLVATSVTWLSNPKELEAFDGAWFLPPIVTLTGITAIFATVFSIRFLFAYQRENWGAREREETKVEQAATRTEQAATEIRHTAEDLRQGAVSLAQGDRQDRQDLREDELDERARQADERGKLQEQGDRQTRQDVSSGDMIKQTAEDVSIVKQDVKTVRAKIVKEEG